jgi:hypothetical protein
VSVLFTYFQENFLKETKVTTVNNLKKSKLKKNSLPRVIKGFMNMGAGKAKRKSDILTPWIEKSIFKKIR